MFTALILALLSGVDVDPLRLSDLLRPRSSIDYLVITTDELIASASRLSRHRRETGLAASYVTMSQVRSVFGEGAHGLQRCLQVAWERWPGELHYVLLLGDTPTGNEVGIPTFRVRGTTDWPGPIASDHPLAGLRDGRWPELAIGRLPVRQPEQAARIIERIIAYDLDRAPGSWRHRVAMFGERGGFGARADAIVEGGVRLALDLLVPQTFQINATFELPGSPFNPHPSDFHAAVVDSINAGALATIYAGHGSSRGLGSLWTADGRLPIFDRSQVNDLSIRSGGSVFFLFACSTAAFDEERASFAERLLLTERGPLAVIAASHLSHPFADIQFGRGMCQQLARTGERRLGDLFLAGKRSLARPDWFARLAEVAGRASGAMKEHEFRELPDYTLRIYHLLGDPGMRFGSPQGRVAMIAHADGDRIQVRGEIPGWSTGEVRISLRRRRGDREASAPPSAPASGLGFGTRIEVPDTERSTRLAHWRAANRTEIVGLDLALESGQFRGTLDLPAGIDRGLYVIHAYASGEQRDAAGAVDCLLGKRGR